MPTADRLLKARLRGLSGEERGEEIKKLRKEWELAFWRKEALKMYREQRAGGELSNTSSALSPRP